MTDPRIPRAAIILGVVLPVALPVLVGIGGCDTRVVELIPAPDAGGSMSVMCNLFVRDDGATCRICFGEDGTATSITCPPPPPPVPTCRVTVDGADRCAVCTSPMGGSAQMACLKCEPAAPSSSGGQCRVCVWSDNPNMRCLQCFAADGTRSEDGCDRVRSETFVYPTPPPDAGSAR